MMHPLSQHPALQYPARPARTGGFTCSSSLGALAALDIRRINDELVALARRGFIHDAYETAHQAVLVSGSALLSMRALDLAQQLPHGGDRDQKLSYHTLFLQSRTHPDLSGDRLYLQGLLKVSEQAARHVGLTAFHFLEERRFTIATTMLATARRLGLQHELLDNTADFLNRLGLEPNDPKPYADGHRPRGVYNPRGPAAWERALEL